MVKVLHPPQKFDVGQGVVGGALDIMHKTKIDQSIHIFPEDGS
jgi:hypothetical protein